MVKTYFYFVIRIFFRNFFFFLSGQYRIFGEETGRETKQTKAKPDKIRKYKIKDEKRQYKDHDLKESLIPQEKTLHVVALFSLEFPWLSCKILLLFIIFAFQQSQFFHFLNNCPGFLKILKLFYRSRRRNS